MRNVIVGVPSYDGRVDVWFAHALIEAIRVAPSRDVSLQPIFLSYDALIQRSRNDLFRLAAEAESDLFFIDSDIEFNPEWIFSLISSGKDVIGAPCPKKSPIVESYNVRALDSGIDVNEEGLAEVDGIGTGFMFISKDAVKQLWDAAEPYHNEGREGRMVFDVKIQEGELVGEDIVFCRKWRELGGTVWAHVGMTCNHVGTMKFSGNFYDFLKRLVEASQQEEEVEEAEVVSEEEA